MAKCVYTIHIPGGGKITIPSDHGIFVNKNSDGSDSVDYKNLNNFLNQLREIEDSTSDDYSKVVSDIHSVVRRVSSLPNLIISSFDFNSTNEEIINDINTQIENSSIGSFYKSLKNYLYKNSDSYLETLEKVSSKPTINYFREVLTPDFVKRNRIIRATNLNDQIDSLSRKITGQNDVHWNNILTFLQSIKDVDGNVLMGFSTEMGLKAMNFGNYSFFKYGNYDSLFMSLFKRIGSSIDLTALNDILSANNLPNVKTASEFFENRIVDNLIDNSDFENLLKDSKHNKTVSEIISLISGNIEQNESKRSKLENTIKDIFKDLNPSTYGENVRRQMMLEERFNQSEKSLNDAAFNQMTINFGELNGSFRANTADEKYALIEDVGSTEYSVVKNKIEEGKDIVQFPIGSVTPYVLVTKIYARPNGVQMYGIYKSDTKGYVHVNKTFLGDEAIRFRKYQGDLDPITDEVVEQSENIVNMNSVSDLNNQEVIKSYIRKGDTVKKGRAERVVAGIYPGYILTTKGEKYRYSDITSFQSSELYSLYDEDLNRNNLNGYLKIKDPSLISKNDIIEDPRPEARGRKVSVVATSDNKVYILTGNENNRFVIPINRSDIKNAWMFAYNKITSSEVDLITDALSNPIIKSKDVLSRFTNPMNVQKGDYFKGNINNVEVVGKVVSDNKIIYVNPSLEGDVILVKTLNDLKNPQFLTSRNIHSQYAISTIRMNNWNINFLPNPQKGYSPIKYIVPNSTDVNDLFLVYNNYANIGSWVETSFHKEGFKDVTNHVLDMINNSEYGMETKGFKPYAKIAFKSGNYNIMSRNTSSTRKILGFENLDIDVKKKLNVLFPGAYISVVDNKGRLKSEIYRINDVSSTEVTAHLNKLNDNGDIITQEEIFKIKDLLQGKDFEGKIKPNAIHSLYIQNGNNKLNTIFTTVGNNLNISQFNNYKNLENLVDKMKNFYGSYGIKVRVDFSGSEFNNEQRAKLTFSESGDMSIVLNGLKGDKSDLIHENLHVILTALRIHDVNTYGRLMDAVVSEEMDVYAKEEMFVERIIDKYKTGSFDALGTNLARTIDGLLKAVKTIDPDPDIDLDLNNLRINPYELLNKPLKEVFKVENSYESPYFRMNVIQAEPAFRNWMRNNITLKCN